MAKLKDRATAYSLYCFSHYHGVYASGSTWPNIAQIVSQRRMPSMNTVEQLLNY